LSRLRRCTLMPNDPTPDEVDAFSRRMRPLAEAIFGKRWAARVREPLPDPDAHREELKRLEHFERNERKRSGS
jgi:hypothetical protein